MDTDLLRFSEIKTRLIDYGRQKKYADLENKVINSVFAQEDENGSACRLTSDDLKPEEYYNFLDWFILELKLEDDRTIMDHFIEENRGELSDGDIGMLEGCRNVFESIFRVEHIMEDGFYAKNLFNLRDYVLKPTVDIEELASLEPGSILWSRVVPFKDFHVFSGAIVQLKFEDVNATINYLLDVISEKPQLYFQDNPAGLEAAVKLQEYERELFIKHFGDDVHVTEGSNLCRDYEEFFMKTNSDVKRFRDGMREGLLKKKRTGERQGESEHGIGGLLEEYSKYKSVAIVYDKVEGLNFLPDFNEFEDAFSAENEADIDSSSSPIIIKYLEDDRISPMAFRRMFAKYPDNARLVLSNILNFKPTEVKTEEELDKYLFAFKSYFYKTRPMPSILPVDFEDFISEIVSA